MAENMQEKMKHSSHCSVQSDNDNGTRELFDDDNDDEDDLSKEEVELHSYLV